MPGTRMPQEDAQAALVAALSRRRPDPQLWDIWLWSGADINTPCPDSGKTALMFAAENAHLKDIEYLLSRGARVDVQNTQNGKTALMYAASAENNMPVIDRLLAAGANNSLRDHTNLLAAGHAKPGSEAHTRLLPVIDHATRSKALKNSVYGENRAHAKKFKLRHR